MSEWKEVTLGDLAFRITSGGTPLTKHSKYYNGSIPWLNTKEIKNCRIFETEKYITELGLNNSSAKLIDSNSVIIAMYGATAGKIAINKIPLTTNQACCNITLDDKKADYNFIYYLLLGSFARLDSLTSGAAQQNLNVGIISNLEILVPKLQEQKAIAQVLSFLDDKIDLLHRQNKTLEEMAQTLFRQWFIEEAKDEWEEKPLSEIANFLNGLACQKFPPKNDLDKLPVLKIKDLKAGISDSSDWATTDVKTEYIIESGDVIFAWSASLMVKIWDGEKCILNQHLFKVTSDNYPKWFYYQWCNYHLDRFIAIAQAHATTMGHIKRKDLDNAMCFVPDENEMKVMDEQIAPLMQKLENNSKQIKTLENMRDTLLSKLMSGEVRVKIKNLEQTVNV